jgi:hypothetical protein
MADHLALLAARASADQRFLGWSLARYQHQQGLSDRLLAQCLAMRPEDLARLRLCCRPDPDAPCSGEQLARMAALARCDADRLAGLLEVLAAQAGCAR